jgi:hypothetical protein
VSALSLPHGMHRGITEATYHQRELIASKSGLELIRRSPSHFMAWLEGAEEEATPAMEFGAAFHCAGLEPDVFAKTYAAEPDFGDCRFKENKAARDEWRRDNAGKKLLSADDYMSIMAMVASVRAHPLAGKMIADGEPELTVRWRDEATGLECKLRADYWVAHHRMVVDLKSALDGSPSEFPKAAANLGYHRQDAFYRSGFAAIGEHVDHFVFVVVEKKPPYAVSVYALDANAVSLGHAQNRRALDMMGECVRTGVWPGYEPTIQTLKLPPWAA